MENIEGEHITLTFDENEDVECEVGGTFYFENKLYIYLFPMDDTNDVYIYRYESISNDAFELIDIEDDKEFEKVSEVFDKLIVCKAWRTFFFENKEYIALSADDEMSKFYIYKCERINDEEFNFIALKDVKESQRVSKFYKNLNSKDLSYSKLANDEEFQKALKNLNSIKY